MFGIWCDLYKMFHGKYFWKLALYDTVRYTHWNRGIAFLMRFSSLAAPKVVKMTIFSAASNEKFRSGDYHAVTTPLRRRKWPGAGSIRTSGPVMAGSQGYAENNKTKDVQGTTAPSTDQHRRMQKLANLGHFLPSASWHYVSLHQISARCFISLRARALTLDQGMYKHRPIIVNLNKDAIYGAWLYFMYMYIVVPDGTAHYPTIYILCIFDRYLKSTKCKERSHFREEKDNDNDDNDNDIHDNHNHNNNNSNNDNNNNNDNKHISSIVVGLCLLCCTNCLLAVVVFSSSCLCPVAVMGRVTTSSKCSWGWLIDSWRNGVMTARGPILLERLWFRNSYSGRNQVGAVMGQK